MNKEKCIKVLYACSIFFILIFIIKSVLDYFKYDEMNNSVPFYDFIIDNILLFLLPSLIIFIIAIILKNKHIRW